MNKIDVHAHYLPPAYEAMLDRRDMHQLDGGSPRPDWSEEQQFVSMEMLSIEKAYLPILSDRFTTLPKVLPADAVDAVNRMADGLSVMEDLQSVYYDLGGVVVPKQLGVLRKMTDDSHILYGSDIPFTPLPVCRKLADDLDNALEGDTAGYVYQENPRRLFQAT